MDWLENLLFNSDSIAHIVLLYSIVISLGVLLGRVKIFGVSLGVTFILFVGILMGHFGFNGNLEIINFVQDFGLILFVFCIGLQVGPSFFSSFKKGGISMGINRENKQYRSLHRIGSIRTWYRNTNQYDFP